MTMNEKQGAAGFRPLSGNKGNQLMQVHDSVIFEVPEFPSPLGE